MRLSSALSVLAGGLMLGWAVQGLAATAAAPPAAPIFYCPRGAEAPQRACPAPNAVTTHHRRHGRVEPRVAERGGDEGLSASQAFIHRYELLHHGFDAAAADEAWRGHDDRGEHWAEMDRHMDGDHHMDMDGRHMDDGHAEQRAEVDQHMAAIDRWGHDADRHFGDLEQHMAKNDERLASVDRRVDEIDRDHRLCCHGARGDGDYRYEQHGVTGGGAYGYSYERRERRSSGGWSYGDTGGWSWGGRYGEGRHGGVEWDWPGGHADRDWRDGDDDPDTQYSGRDAYGYLTWPGKTPAAEGERQ